MADRYSVATAGDWTSVNTWATSSGGVPGASVPASGDTAIIENNNTVTVDEASLPIKVVQINGGKMVITDGCGLKFDDASGAYIRLYAAANSGFDSNGTHASLCTLASESATPSRPWSFQIDDMSPDTRTLDFGFLECHSVQWRLGNDSIYVEFNTGGTSAQLDSPPPCTRMPNIIEHDILGRVTGRIGKYGNKAGTMAITGRVLLSTHDAETLCALERTNDPISLVTMYHHLPRCTLESLKFQPVPGDPWLDFTATLVENL